MACACKVNRDISYIQKKYGVKGKEQPKTNIVEKVKTFFINCFLVLINIIFFPIMLLVILFHSSKGKTISIRKTLDIMMHPFKFLKKNE